MLATVKDWEVDIAEVQDGAAAWLMSVAFQQADASESVCDEHCGAQS